MFRTLFFMVAAILAATSAEAQQQANCVGSNILFAANQDVTSDLTVRKGQSCGRMMTGGQNQITSIQFPQMPQHGTLRRSGRLGYVYTPRKGFTGQDQFRVRYIGYRVDDAGNRAFDLFLGVLVRVNVVP